MLDANGDGLDTTENGALRTSLANVVLSDQVDGSVVDTRMWSQSVSGMAIAVVNGFVTLNSGAVTTPNSYATNVSNKYIPFYGILPVRMSLNAKTLNIPEANATVEVGMGVVSGTSVPTDGAFFRWGPAGQLFCVINNSGAESSSGALTSPPSGAIAHLFEIEVVENHVQFFIDDELVADIAVPSGQAYPFNAGHQQAFQRVYTSGTAPSVAPQFAYGQLIVVQQDINAVREFGDTISSFGRGWYQSGITPFGQTANHTNNTALAAITLSNTVAGYTTLGGKFLINAAVGGTTDGIVFAFQNNTTSQLPIPGVSISTAITGAAIATATLLEWSLGIDSTAASLATVDGVGTWGPRRIPLGVQGFLALAGIGTVANDLTRRFDKGMPWINPGRYFHLICTIPNGAATPSLAFRGALTILGGANE